LFDFLSLNKGTAFINAGLDYLIDMSSAINNKIFYGGKGNAFEADVFQSEPLLALEIKSEKWGTQKNFYPVGGRIQQAQHRSRHLRGRLFWRQF